MKKNQFRNSISRWKNHMSFNKQNELVQKYYPNTVKEFGFNRAYLYVENDQWFHIFLAEYKVLPKRLKFFKAIDNTEESWYVQYDLSNTKIVEDLEMSYLYPSIPNGIIYSTENDMITFEIPKNHLFKNIEIVYGN